MLKTVLIPRRLLTSRTSPTNLWKNGAWKKARFFLCSFSIWVASDFSSGTPNLSSTSLLPLLLEIARFPCFATVTPIAPRINATAVEIFIVLNPSPPVPQTSIIGVSSSKVVLYSKILFTKAVNDSG